jgi:elongation factor 3
VIDLVGNKLRAAAILGAQNTSEHPVEVISAESSAKTRAEMENRVMSAECKRENASPEQLLEKGFGKLVQQFDDLESSREGAGTRDTSAHIVRKHLEDIGLDGDIAQYNEISGAFWGSVVITAHFCLCLC